LFPDPRGQCARRQVADQLTQPDQRDEEGGEPDAGPEVTSGQGHQWQDRALPIDTSRVGPYAGTAMSRSRVGAVGSGRPPPPVATSAQPTDHVR
jgi:hypothetical protein